MNIYVQDYFPPHIQKIEEFQALGGAVDAGLMRLWGALEEVYENQYLDTLNSEGCNRLETMLGIIPKRKDTIDARRERLKLQWMRNLPYTPNALRESIEAIIRRDEYRLSIKTATYQIGLVILDQEVRVLKEIRDMVLDMIPANMILVFTGQYPLNIPVGIRTGNCLELAADFFARYNRAFLLLDGSWLLDGAYLLNGYKELENTDFYPVDISFKTAFVTEMETDTERLSVGTEATHSGAVCSADMAIRVPVTMTTDSNATIKVAGRVPAGPESACKLTVEKDLWYLDGSFLLDGTKLLDAEIFEYEL